jgi:hypothetical protein
LSGSSHFNRINPDQAVAICSRTQAQQLVNYDHHVVDVNGRRRVMLTYEWMPVEDHSGPFLLTVVFHHVAGHPTAPDEIQEIVSGLSFRVRGQPR